MKVSVVATMYRAARVACCISPSPISQPIVTVHLLLSLQTACMQTRYCGDRASPSVLAHPVRLCVCTRSVWCMLSRNVLSSTRSVSIHCYVRSAHSKTIIQTVDRPANVRPSQNGQQTTQETNLPLHVNMSLFRTPYNYRDRS